MQPFLFTIAIAIDRKINRMTIMYRPEEIFNVKNAVGGAVVKATALAASDYLAGNNQPWAYYLGAIFGQAAMATGIIGAATTIYVIGDTLDFYVFKSPDGSDLRYFLNGVQLASLDTYAATSAWELIQNVILAPNQVNELTFVNYAASVTGGASGIAFLTLGDMTVFGNNAFAYQGESVHMANDVITFRTQDSETGADLGAIPIYIPHGFTVSELQTWADLAAKELDDAMNVKVVEIDLLMPLTVVGTVKASPVANSLNERGGLLTFTTSGDYADSVRLPGILTSLMPGDAIATTNALITAIITRLTTQTTAANIRPVTKHSFNWLAIRNGKKSLRR